MSLKAVHIAFITLAVVLCLGAGAWGFSRFAATSEPGFLFLAFAGLLMGVGLVYYIALFLKQMKGTSLL